MALPPTCFPRDKNATADGGSSTFLCRVLNLAPPSANYNFHQSRVFFSAGVSPAKETPTLVLSIPRKHSFACPPPPPPRLSSQYFIFRAPSNGRERTGAVLLNFSLSRLTLKQIVELFNERQCSFAKPPLQNEFLPFYRLSLPSDPYRASPISPRK